MNAEKIATHWADITDEETQESIIRLWHRDVDDTEYRTGICRKFDCSGRNCRFSHFKMRGYPMKRCNECARGGCRAADIAFYGITLGGQHVKMYSVCKGAAVVFEG